MNMINLTIDGIKTQVPEGTTILKAANRTWDRYTHIVL
jgi:NADH dehydrogenase/NADH:ubiquinone oxidoreductase subunit G